MFTSAQLRAARALLGLSREALAAAAGIEPSEVAAAEADSAALATESQRMLHEALEAAGAVFIAAGEGGAGGPGVRLRDGAAEPALRPEELNAANDD